MNALLKKAIGGLLVVLWIASSAKAWAAPPTAAEVQRLMDEQPVSVETWPLWRDYYVRLYYAYDVGEPEDFYLRLGKYVGQLAQENQGNLPGALKDDPVAWIILSSHLTQTALHAHDPAVAAAREAVELGDPQAISSQRLANALVAAVSVEHKPGELPREAQDQLWEAQNLLEDVQRTVPDARLDFSRGQIAWLRGEPDKAIPLLRQGALDHAAVPHYAVHYLSLWLTWPAATPPFADESAKWVEKFPDNAKLLALHAVALHRDERFFEAWEALEKSRRISSEGVQMLGEQGVAMLDEGKWVTPQVAAGMKFLQDKSSSQAIVSFRAALAEDQDNFVAARWLAQALLEQPDASSKPGGDRAVLEELKGLSAKFPDDAQLHVAYAAALHRAGKNTEADAELKRARALGLNVDALLGPSGTARIQAAARQQAQTRVGGGVLIGALAVFCTWIGVMYGMGALLAICTPRTPAPQVFGGDAMSSGERWLQRFYLVILSLSLVVFYLSVPFVVLGLLAITLALFGIMLVLRILHIGILYRGLYATWGVLRSLFLGPGNDVLGIKAEAEKHPHLFRTLHEVADKLQTSPVDTVYLTPSSSIGVREAGKGPFGLFRRQRVLEIGVSTLSVLTAAEFKSILAHEYAHFSHSDAFYTRFISQVSNSLAHSLAVMNAAAGGLNYVNPFYWLYWLYLRAYALLGAGFSRSREFLADRRAVQAYGRDTFVSGLRKVCVDGLLFDGSAFENVRSELGAGRAYVNVFDAFRQYRDLPEQSAAQAKVAEELHRAKPHWFDSHPTLSERMAAVNGFSTVQNAADSRPATDLLSDFCRVEEELTSLLTAYIHNYCDIIDTRHLQTADDGEPE